MRVKLSYTVDEEDVLKESAKILNLSAEDLQQAIGLFQDTQKELVGVDPERKPSVAIALEMITELRSALLAVDTRLLEVAEIVEAYDDYVRNQRAPVAPLEEAPGPVVKE